MIWSPLPISVRGDVYVDVEEIETDMEEFALIEVDDSADEMNVGDKVLDRLPTDQNKVLRQWKGPFEIIERLNTDNRGMVKGKPKTYHAERAWKRKQSVSDGKRWKTK